jgi:hypothetical protein
MLALVFVNPHLVGLDRTLREVRHNQSDMTCRRHHGVGLIRGTLSRDPSMRVDVGYHYKAGLPTHLPQWPVTGTVELDDPAVQGMRIEVIVVSQPSGLAAIPVPRAQDECAAFPLPCTTAAKFANGLAPKARRTAQAMIRRYACPNNRAN